MPGFLGLDRLVELVEKHWGAMWARIVLAILTLCIVLLLVAGAANYVVGPLLRWTFEIAKNRLSFTSALIIITLSYVLLGVLGLWLSFEIPNRVWFARYQRLTKERDQLLGEVLGEHNKRAQRVDQRIQNVEQNLEYAFKATRSQTDLNKSVLDILKDTLAVAKGLDRRVTILENSAKATSSPDVSSASEEDAVPADPGPLVPPEP